MAKSKTINAAHRLKLGNGFQGGLALPASLQLSTLLPTGKLAGPKVAQLALCDSAPRAEARPEVEPGCEVSQPLVEDLLLPSECKHLQEAPSLQQRRTLGLRGQSCSTDLHPLQLPLHGWLPRLGDSCRGRPTLNTLGEFICLPQIPVTLSGCLSPPRSPTCSAPARWAALRAHNRAHIKEMPLGHTKPAIPQPPHLGFVSLSNSHKNSRNSALLGAQSCMSGPGCPAGHTWSRVPRPGCPMGRTWSRVPHPGCPALCARSHVPHSGCPAGCTWSRVPHPGYPAGRTWSHVHHPGCPAECTWSCVPHPGCPEGTPSPMYPVLGALCWVPHSACPAPSTSHP